MSIWALALLIVYYLLAHLTVSRLFPAKRALGHLLSVKYQKKKKQKYESRVITARRVTSILS